MDDKWWTMWSDAPSLFSQPVWPSLSCFLLSWMLSYRTLPRGRKPGGCHGLNVGCLPYLVTSWWCYLEELVEPLADRQTEWVMGKVTAHPGPSHLVPICYRQCEEVPYTRTTELVLSPLLCHSGLYHPNHTPLSFFPDICPSDRNSNTVLEAKSSERYHSSCFDN